jgi:NadR type nicotinamide-nucleotide adenylyltransferase
MAQDPRARTRICLTGPECTGKTTLAQRLARELGVQWVPEYAREFAEACNNNILATDVEAIARGQMANEDRATGDVVILDTDLISTVVYARHYYGACPAWIEDEARERRADLYLLLDTDVAWQPDAARDASDDAREDLFDAFGAALDEFETNWVIVSGDWEERAAQAAAGISSVMSNRHPSPDATTSP